MTDRSTRILVVASAGSGKTEVLTQRLAHLLTNSQGEAFRCLAVTYTVKAAQELRRRIEASVDSERWRVDADTLHGFALEWLRQYGQCVDVSPDVVVYSDDADRIRLIFDYVASLGLQEAVGPDEMTTLRPILTEIDSHRTLRPGTPYPDDGRERLGIAVKDLYEGYLDALDQAGGIDFPGMLTKFLAALHEDPWIGENFRSLFRHVLIDEAQDLTPAQAELLACLAGDSVHIFAVADDRQSINGFAGGAFDNARRLVGPSAVTLSLSHNFRSSVRVLRAAESLARHFESHSVTPRIVDTAPPGALTVIACSDVADEARRAADWVQDLLDRGLSIDTIAEGEDPKVAPEDIAVIGRTRWTLDPILAELRNRGIGCAVQVEASGFLTAPEARVALDALALEANPNDRPAQRRIVEELHGMDVEWSGGDIVESLRGSTVPSLFPIAALLSEFRKDKSLEDTMAHLSGVNSSSWAEDAVRIQSLWAGYRAATDSKHRDLRGFLRFVNQSERTRPTDPGVRVMTIHRVKGLEFRAVAVVGVREGTMPDYRARTTKQVDAERRAFYVAMTRASRALLVTWPKVTQDRYGRQHVQQRSPFLDEASI